MDARRTAGLAVAASSPDDPAVSDGDRGENFFDSFANAMLERSLPAIRDWLSSRLGDGARIGSVTLDERTVVVSDAQIPIGARVTLNVQEARLDARPEDLIAGLPPARLRSLRGTVEAREGQLRVFSAPIEFVGSGASKDAWVQGEVRLGGATWKLESEVGDALPIYGTAQVHIDGDGWRVRDAALTTGASRTRFNGAGGLRGARLTAAKINTEFARWVHLRATLSAFLGRSPATPIPVPLSAVIGGQASLNAGRWEADLTLRSDRSDLALTLETRSGQVLRSELTGAADASELLPASADRLMDRDRSGAAHVHATASGPFDALDAEIDLRWDGLVAPWLDGPRPATATLEIEEARRGTVSLRIEGAGVLRGRLGIAPFGSIDGEAQATLHPSALVLGPLRADGDPVEVVAQIGGTRKEPDLSLTLEGPRVSARRERESITLRRARADIELRGREGRLTVHRAEVSARVGPGSARAVFDGTETALSLARVDAEQALAGVSLFFEQSVVGTRPGSRFVLPEAAQLWANLTLCGRDVTGTAHLEAAHSRLSLTPFRYRAGSFDGTKATSTLAFDDAVALGLFGGSALAPRGKEKASVRLELTGTGEAMRFRVRAEAPRTPIGPADAPTIATLHEGALELEIGPQVFEMRALTGRLFGGQLEARGGVRGEGEQRVLHLDLLRLTDANRGLRERLLGDRRSISHDVLRGLSLDVRLSGALDHLSGRASARTDLSAVELVIDTADGVIARGSSLSGHLHPRDLSPWLAPVVIDGDPYALTASITGRLRSPEVRGTIVSDAQSISIGARGAEGSASVRFDAAQLQVEFELGPDGASVPAASAIVGGGRVQLSAVRSRLLGGLLARLDIRDLELGSIEGIADELEGALSLKASLWQLGALGVSATAQVDRPKYRALRRLSMMFARYGLRDPDPASISPLTATLRIQDGELEINSVQARHEAFELVARGRRSAFGIWRADAEVTVTSAFLETSHLFVGPARWFGDVVVPVRASGPEGRVRVHADLMAALDHILKRTRLGRGLERAINALFERTAEARAARTKSSAPKQLPASTLTSVDALVDQIARDATPAGPAVGALLDRGLTPEEIVERVRRRRS